MRNARSFIALLGSVAALLAGAVILTTHAADQAPPPGVAQRAQGTTPAAAAGPRSGATPTPTNTVAIPPQAAADAGHRSTPAPNTAATNAPAKPGAPQVPEQSATIRDDPTLVPDPKQSADNSVSFPNDI
jgi:hypothetical protein